MTVQRHMIRALTSSDDPERCWIWTGLLGDGGYGRAYDPGTQRTVAAHRASYEAFIGPIPDGLVIDHLCRNRACVNPTHLEPVTQRVNVLRGEGPTAERARRTHCKEGHPLSGDNLYIHPTRGHRSCKACQAANRRDRAAGLKKTPPCSVGGCDRASVAKGLCDPHYAKERQASRV
jgi:hypothetical protein